MNPLKGNSRISGEGEEMLEKVIAIVAEQLSIDESELSAETNFKDDLGADSLDLFELVMAFEEEYDMEIPSEDLEKLTTIGAVVEYLKGTGID